MRKRKCTGKALGIYLCVLAVLAAGCPGVEDGIEPLLEKTPDPERYALVTGGTYWRGSPDVDYTAINEYPLHKVTVSSFYIGKYEVTQKEWKEVMNLTVEEQHVLSKQAAGNFRGSGDDLPINFVCWYDAVEFCNRLSKQDGLTPAYTVIQGGTWFEPTIEVEWNREANGWRLPTEAEWEYACRAGTTTRYNTGAFEEDLARAAWYYKNSQIEVDGVSKPMLHAVGTKEPNAWGIYDMHGNVYELCWDVYVENYDRYADGTLSATDPAGPDETSVKRTIRGGSIMNTITLTESSAVDFFYCARRSQTNVDTRGQNFGLRIVRSCPSEPVDPTDPARPALPESPVLPPDTPVTPTTPDGLVLAPAGTFTMGGNPEGATNADSAIAHSVTLTQPFFMSKYEVTQKQWKDVMGKTLAEWITANGINSDNNRGEGDTLPMNNVNWCDAVMFCNKLSAQEGLTPVYTLNGSANPDDWGPVPINTSDAELKALWNTMTWNREANGWRLPTEAEWEYACRAGTTTRYNTGDNWTDLLSAAWCAENSGTTPALQPVGTKTANVWGLYDMHGNVFEWCWDFYASPYASEAQTDPAGPATNSNGNRVERGGAFNNARPTEASTTNNFFFCARRMNSSMIRSFNTGFRIVRNAA
jgi:formylglycine-generating enzyme required for sulfatase activity